MFNVLFFKWTVNAFAVKNIAACSYLFHLPLSLSENYGYDSEEEEQLAPEGTGFQDETAAPYTYNYIAPESGESDALENEYPEALPSTTSTGNVATDTPILTSECSTSAFQIALSAGRLKDIHVKGMCQGASMCQTTNLQN